MKAIARTILAAYVILSMTGCSPKSNSDDGNDDDIPAKGTRPEKPDRKFVSEAVEAIIDSVSPLIADDKLREMFAICFPNTLDTTVKFQTKDGKPDTFVITGDINAMWLRDSSAQVWPYLSLIQKDEHLREMVAGLINRQAWCLNIDPYANAFNEGPTGSYWESDYTDHMVKELHERKYELDSQCYPIRLAYQYWFLTGDTSVFDDVWQKAMKLVVETMRKQQRKDGGRGDYRFSRECNRPTDSQINSGWGAPVRYTGMIYSAFRPSDDATQYGFLVPSNMMATVSLRQLAKIEREIYKDKAFAAECENLADEVENGIRKYAVVDHPSHGKVFAYEVDGYGNHTFMDDANVPSLLSAPYLGYCAPDDSIYANTRRLVWSEDNPYFFKGKAGEGIGGPHVGYDYPWPMSIIMRGLTSTDPEEVKECLKMLRDTNGGTYMMHESFYSDDPTDFTRSWFAWANTLFGELILKTAAKHPEILSNPL